MPAKALNNNTSKQRELRSFIDEIITAKLWYIYATGLIHANEMSLLKAALLSLLFIPSVGEAQKYDPATWTNIRVSRLDSSINSKRIEIVSCFNPAGTQLWFSTKRGFGPDQLSTCDYRYGRFEDVVIGARLYATGAITMDDLGESYFAMLSPNSDSANPNDIDIYKVILPGESVEALPPTVNTHGFESQPHISRDGKTLFYAVAIRRLEKEHNVDIFVSHRNADGWSKGRPLSREINSEGYEGFPVLSPDGRFLFFMRRTNSKDPAIFYSAKTEDGWDTPRALPSPINTGKEMSMAFHPRENLLIIGSARHSDTGKDFDLYEVRYDLEH